MLEFATEITKEKLKNADYSGQIEAISKSQAVVEYDTTGNILWANDNFLVALAYNLDEVKGQNHSMFLEPSEKISQSYGNFWNELRAGSFKSGEYKHVAKGGNEIWIQASYNPILDMNGKVFKIVSYANVITEQKLKNAYFEGQIQAIGKSQAVIEFNVDGIIQWANDNVCLLIKKPVVQKNTAIFGLR